MVEDRALKQDSSERILKIWQYFDEVMKLSNSVDQFFDLEMDPQVLPMLFLFFWLLLSDFQCTKAPSFLNWLLWNFSHITMTIN